MTSTPADKTPLTILTGFLGAGKTTLLNRILHAEHGLKIAVLVNDFGALNIDAQLVVGVAADDTVQLSNGCICCTIRGELLQALLDVLRRDDPPDYILIEASGVSDPIDVALAIRAIHQVQIDSIIAVIDAEQFTTIDAGNRTLALNQVGVADLLVLNKVDLATPEQLDATRKAISKISPQARIFETTHAAVPLDLLLGVGRYDPLNLPERTPHDVHVHETDSTHDHAHDHSLAFDTWRWQSSQPLSRKALQRAVDALPPSVYRAKGIFFLADAPERRAVLHVVGKRATLDADGVPWAAELPNSQLVLIAAHGTLDPQALQAQFDAALAVNAPKNELERLATSALAWLRKNRT